jgi:cytoskeletal protein CcmA (bactofilin family)
MIKMALDFIKNIFNKKRRHKEIVADFQTSIIKVDNNFISASSLMLKEKLFSNIFSLREVNVAASSEISGNIICRSCVISGMVSGDIRSYDYAEIKSTANIAGNILARSIKIELGAIINGSIQIDNEIDERELIELVESRLQFRKQVDISTVPFLIVEQPKLEVVPELELPSESLPLTDSSSELNRKTVTPSVKTNSSKQSDVDEATKNSTNSWY